MFRRPTPLLRVGAGVRHPPPGFAADARYERLAGLSRHLVSGGASPIVIKLTPPPLHRRRYLDHHPPPAAHRRDNAAPRCVRSAADKVLQSVAAAALKCWVFLR
ncbi:hypothetical protein E2C01_015632 [Portunus trituberculatus]|uniref:Uncharacterized protein n=1 Tax=Portunus trituberculatus TaxID=210409 RepID=A0A5B7DN63_PORTR|nr:hypothetical protein [Portunus trituberculatus]